MRGGRSYCWGKDLSGELEGAGGIGGLLMVREGGATYAARYDANGNLVGFYNLTDDNIALRVEYGPYGEVLTSRGYYTSCPFGFSTKYRDQETGLYSSGTGTAARRSGNVVATTFMKDC